MSFTDWPWRHWRTQRAEKPALRLDDDVLTWQQLCARIDSLAAGFHRQGVQEGDGVMLLAHNHPQTLLAWPLASWAKRAARVANTAASGARVASGSAALSRSTDMGVFQNQARLPPGQARNIGEGEGAAFSLGRYPCGHIRRQRTPPGCADGQSPPG